MSRRSEILRLHGKIEVQRKLEERLDTRKLQRLQFRALLGDHDGNVVMSTEDPRWVYVRREGRAVIGRVLNLRVANIPDLPVLVGFSDELPNQLQVLSIAGDQLGWALGYTDGSGGPGLLAHHHTQHEFRRDAEGGNDIVWVNTHQITDGLVYPPTTSGLNVNVHKCWYAYGTSSYFFDAVEDADPEDGAGLKISNAVTALGANGACWILVYIDTTVDPHELAIEIGDEFPALLFPPEGSDLFPEFPYGSVPLAGLYVEDDDTAITWSNIYDQRLFPTGVAGVVGATQHELLDGDVHPDTADVDPTTGDIIIADVAGDWNVLNIDVADRALISTGTLPAWTEITAAIVGYTPGELLDWLGGADPGQVDDALDQLADRVTDAEADKAAVEMLHTHVVNEDLTAVCDGARTVFGLMQEAQEETTQVYKNGSRMRVNDDYTETDLYNTITFAVAPDAADELWIDYVPAEGVFA